MRLGVDTGGTFTDFVQLDDNGRLHIHKQLSTPDDPSRAILAGIAHLQLPISSDVVHGSTVATNALLERRGAKAALITTAGFADVLAIGRQNRPDIYALVPQKPPPFIPRSRRLEVTERLDAHGNVLTPLDEASLTAVLNQLSTDPVESVAICLLFSFLNPRHEQQIAIRLRERFPDLFLSLSSQILPEYREYERTSTTVINAYVAPLMSRYLQRLAAGVAPRRLTVMQSNGGVIAAETAGEEAARTALSGPAGGVVGAQFVANLAGLDQLITFDMGGTSTDVALCPGQLPTTSTGEIGGMPLRLPLIDIHTVGAGGGSLATIDAGGALKVGPQSAGADPGPICYGQKRPSRLGEHWVTVTDANLVLGRLDEAHFLGGKMRLDKTAAFEAMTHLAQQMGAPSAEAAALGVVQVANANMERAIRKISVERGYDPRRFALIPFGGAGPLHACELASNLQIPTIFIPAVPGVLSALGMLVAAPTKDYSRTWIQSLPEWTTAVHEQLRSRFAPLVSRAQAEMAAEGHEPTTLSLQYRVDMRYRGQSHELSVRFMPHRSSESLIEQFHQVHEQRYGYRQAAAVVELVTMRLTAVAPTAPVELEKRPLSTQPIGEAVMGEKLVWFETAAPQPTKQLDRDRLLPGQSFSGPAIIIQYDTTILVTPNWRGRVDEFGNLHLTRVE